MRYEGGKKFCCLLSISGCEKEVIRSSRAAKNEYNFHLKHSRHVIPHHAPLLQSAFLAVHQQPGYFLQDDFASPVCLWSAANPGGGTFCYSATCADSKHWLLLSTLGLTFFVLWFLSQALISLVCDNLQPIVLVVADEGRLNLLFKGAAFLSNAVWYYCVLPYSVSF